MAVKRQRVSPSVQERVLGMRLATRVKLSAMMFLQYMMLPVWLNTVIPYIKTLPGGDSWVLWCGMIIGIGNLASPIFGMLADRMISAEKLLALSNLIYAVLMGLSCFVSDPALLFALLVACAILNLPGWALSASIAMGASSSSEFASVRVFGSLGWVASSVFSIVAIGYFGYAEFDTSRWIFAAAACTALVGAFVAYIQPATPPKALGSKISFVDAFGLRAFSLFKRSDFAIFVTLVVLSMVPFMWYMTYNTQYLQESGFKYLNLTQNLGTVGELGFMLLVPVLVKKFGYRWSMVIALCALAFRYICFGASVALDCHIFDFGGILIHGLIFGVIIVGALMYVEDTAPAGLKNQAQGMIMTLMTSLGTFISVLLFDGILGYGKRADGTHDWFVAFAVAAVISIALAVCMSVTASSSKRVNSAS